MNRIEMINRSLRCFVFGLLGLVPLLGIPASAVSFVQYWQVAQQADGDWNPAESYLAWGLVLAIMGLGLSFVFCAVMVLAIINGVT